MSTRHHHNRTVYYTHNDDSRMPTIIMIHGFRGTHHGLDLIAKELSDYRVIVPDLPGFGESSPLEAQHSVENYVEWLKDFIDSLGLNERPILLGHSFGSIVVSSYASLYQKSISKLIIINPIGSPALKGPKALMTKIAIFYYWCGRKMPEKLAVSILGAKPIVLIMSVIMAKTKDRKLRRFIHHQHLSYFSLFYSRQVLDEAFHASIEHNVREYAGKITTPTLIIAGELDDITTLDDQRSLAKSFVRAQIVELGDVGHLIPYEKPTAAAEAIKRFCSR
jgi:pimeloyl-ACP methyl ester carboxylesterase